MAEESPLHRKQNKRTKLLWSMLSGLALGVHFAVWFYFILENDSLSFFLTSGGRLPSWAYALLYRSPLLCNRFLRGRATKNPFDGARLSS